MQFTTLLLAALGAVTAVYGASAAAGQPPPPGDPDLSVPEDPTQWREENEFVPFAGDRFDGFDWRLCQEVVRLAPAVANLIVSPVSVKLLLGMLYEGASGTTAQELEDALQLTAFEPRQRRDVARTKFTNVVAALQQKNPDFSLDLALRMFLDNNFTPRNRYSKILRYFYNVELEDLDFRKQVDAARQVNYWVNKSTNGLINNLVKPDDLRDVEMMLANAIFFDGKWLNPFSDGDTAPANFFARPGYTYNTSFMSQNNDFYYYNSSAVGAQILRMPYKGGRYSMFVVLPNDRFGLDALLERLTPDRVRQLMWNMTLNEVMVLMPRFSFDTRTDMREVLRSMGVRAMFERGVANLQGVVSLRQAPLFVSSVLQKAVVQVDELGTRAAAATEASTSNRFGGGVKTVFSARHPFLFFIEDETTATVLFVGRVSEPRAAADPAPTPASVAPPTRSYGFDFSGEAGDLAPRFGNDVDEPRRPGVVTTSHRRPEPTTPAPTQPQQPPRHPTTDGGPSYQTPYYNWLWRQGSNVFWGRQPPLQQQQPFTPIGGQQQQPTGPGVYLLPLYVPLR